MIEVIIWFWIASIWVICVSNFLVFISVYSNRFHNEVEFLYIARNVLNCYAWKQDLGSCASLIRKNLFGNLAKFSDYVVEEQGLDSNLDFSSSMHRFKFTWGKASNTIEILLPVA